MAILSDNNLGCSIQLPWEQSAGALFGESQTRVIVSINPDDENKLAELCLKEKVGYYKIGKTQKNNFSINSKISFSVEVLRNKFERAIPSIMK
jgi:phosphoribosylformylglycinamidine (FGAM) synthase-like enzyme